MEAAVLPAGQCCWRRYTLFSENILVPSIDIYVFIWSLPRANIFPNTYGWNVENVTSKYNRRKRTIVTTLVLCTFLFWLNRNNSQQITVELHFPETYRALSWWWHPLLCSGKGDGVMVYMNRPCAVLLTCSENTIQTVRARWFRAIHHVFLAVLCLHCRRSDCRRCSNLTLTVYSAMGLNFVLYLCFISLA